MSGDDARERLGLRGSEIDASDSSTRSRREWAAATATTLLAVAILFAPLSRGIPRAHDIRDHLGATAQVLTSLRSGDLYPRWLSEFHGGWGEPTLLFYPPGLYLVSAPLAALFGGDVLSGLFAALVLFALAGCLGAFVFVRRRFGALSGVLAALVYALLPFRVFEVYCAGLYSSFAAWSLLPWALVSLGDCADEAPEAAGRPAVAAWPLLFAAIALLNLPAVVLLSFLTAVWLAVRVVATRRLRGALHIVALSAWGAAIAGIHLIPALAEMSTVQILGADLYRGNFLFQGQGSGMSAGMQLVFDRMGLFPGLALAAALCALGASRPLGDMAAEERRRSWVMLVGLIGGASLFFATPTARWAWEWLPVLQSVNLPWRLLEPLGAAAACAAAAGAILVAHRGGLPRLVRIAVAPFLLGVGVLSLAFDASLSAANGTFSAADCRAAIPQFARKEAYFLPRGARRAAEQTDVPPLACDQPCRVTVLEQSPARRRFRVTAQAPMHLAVRTYFFPGWIAQRIDGGSAQSLPIGAEPGTGRIVVELPPGESLVELSFGTTPDRRVGGAVSLFALLSWTAWVTIRWRRAGARP